MQIRAVQHQNLEMGKPNNSLKHDEKGVQSKDALESILTTVVTTGHDEYEYNIIGYTYY